ncbi:unnamed protein product [marine sediment metagenome]|uniref:ASCH domain-containing protein n=1 Tax=marine sediment metagenome TaxID=412755 RepID=X1TYD8_9ZZZZ
MLSEIPANVIEGLWNLLREGKLKKYINPKEYAAEYERLDALRKQFNCETLVTVPKLQTIRLCRKRPTKPGETLYLYTGMRTKDCIKLGEIPCKTVEPLEIQEYMTGPLVGVAVHRAGHWRPLTHEFAQADGFNDMWAMQEWFEKTHRLSPKNPLFPELITW